MVIKRGDIFYADLRPVVGSVILTEQIRTIDKRRLKEKIGHIDDNHIMSQINNALGVSFGLD